MSLKVFSTTRTFRRWQHRSRIRKPNAVRAVKQLSQRGERRRVRRQLQVFADPD